MFLAMLINGADLIADDGTADQSINQEFANISSLLAKFDELSKPRLNNIEHG